MFNKLERLMSINGNSYVTVFRSEHFEIHRFWHQDYEDRQRIACAGGDLVSALKKLTEWDEPVEDEIISELDAILREGYDLSMFANMSNSFSAIIAPAGAKAGELSANKSLREALREAVIKHRHNAEEK